MAAGRPGKKTVTYNVKVAGKHVAVVNPELAAVDADVEADAEVVGAEGPVGAVLLEGHLALEEGTLGRAAVDLLGLGDHDGVVFKEVEDHDEAETGVFQAALDNAFLKVGKKSQDL